ncbi:MAG: family rane protein [Phycisphaerales bacterium]|nr:family rane protein [Phycisphaerales bacterium]
MKFAIPNRRFLAPHSAPCTLHSAFLFVLLFFCCTARSAPATQPAGQDLLAHGTDDHLWVGYVSVPPFPKGATEQTRIAFRVANKDEWEFLTNIGARAIGLANRGTQLAVLLEGGDWVLVSEDGSSASGQPLPDGAKLLALGNDASTLWAVGLLPPNATTQPAGTQPAATQAAASQPAATQPATTQAAAEMRATSRLGLFTLNEGNWVRASGPLLPADLSSAAAMSLAMIDRVPYLAVRRDDDSLQVLRLSDDTWKEVGQGPRIPAPAGARGFKLLANAPSPILWLTGVTHDSLYFLNPTPRVVEMLDVSAPPQSRAAAIASHTLRELAVANTTDVKLTQQDYDLTTGKNAGSPVTISLPRPVTPSVVSNLIRVGMVVGLIILIWATSGRRQEGAEGVDRAALLDLAPLPRRLAAGAIDALPFVVPLALMGHIARLTDFSADVSPAPPGWEMAFWISLLCAIILYITHTALFETFTGRSIGKALTGLRVATLDGGTPETASLLIRNFLRIIDVALGGVTLLLIVFSPLRQRIGDVVGGTVVVRDRVRPEGVLDDEAAAEELAKTQSAGPETPVTPPTPEPPEPAGRTGNAER